jgi:hypothetical protein
LARCAFDLHQNWNRCAARYRDASGPSEKLPWAHPVCVAGGGFCFIGAAAKPVDPGIANLMAGFGVTP